MLTQPNLISTKIRGILQVQIFSTGYYFLKPYTKSKPSINIRNQS